MSRIRTIKPEWLADEKLNQAGDAGRVLSVALITLADDYGNGRATVGYIAGQVWSGELESSPRETLEKARETLARLQNIGFIDVYRVRGQQYFHLCGWDTHQRVDRKSKPRVPGPDEAETKGFSTLAKPSRDPRETLAPDLDLDLDLDHDRDQDQMSPKPPEGAVADGTSSREKPRPPPSAKELLENSTPSDVERVFLHWVKVHRKKPGSTRLDSKRRKLIGARLRDTGGDIGLLLRAIEGNARDEWCRQGKHHGLSLVFRDMDHIERYADKALRCAEVEDHPIARLQRAKEAAELKGDFEERKRIVAEIYELTKVAS